MSKKVHCRSLSSIHIHYNHDPVQALYSLPGRCTQLAIFNCTEVVVNPLTIQIATFDPLSIEMLRDEDTSHSHGKVLLTQKEDSNTHIDIGTTHTHTRKSRTWPFRPDRGIRGTRRGTRPLPDYDILKYTTAAAASTGPVRLAPAASPADLVALLQP